VAGDGVLGVVDEVEEDLLHLIEVQHGLRDERIELLDDFEVVDAQLIGLQVDRLLDDALSPRYRFSDG